MAKSVYVDDAGNTVGGQITGGNLPSMSSSEAGTVPATGTPSGKYLRDDATWATPAGGSGGVESHIIFVSLGVAQSI